MGPYKKCVFCIMTFFIHSPQLHFVSFILYPPLCYSLKITNYGMREKKIFCIYGCFSVSSYIKGCRRSHLQRQSSFYLRYTDRLLDVFSLLLALILSGLHQRSTRKEGFTEKGNRRKMTCRFKLNIYVFYQISGIFPHFLIIS